MKKFFLITILFLLCSTVKAQTQYYHEFEEKNRQVYIKLTAHAEEVYGLTVLAKQNGNCTGFVQSVQLDEEGIIFPSGTKWKVDTYEDGIKVQFSDGNKSVKYKRVSDNPLRGCSLRKGRDI